MADDVILPEELVEQIAEAARKLSPLDAAAFRDLALENFAAFREQQSSDDRSASARSSIPRNYARRLVFGAFVGVFLDPVELAVADLELLARFDGPEGFPFASVGEDEALSETLMLRQTDELREARDDLRTMAEGIGQELFGSNFNLEEFSRGDAENAQG